MGPFSSFRPPHFTPELFSRCIRLYSRTTLPPLGRAVWWARGPALNWKCPAQLLTGLGPGENWLASQHLSFLSCKWGNSSRVVVRMRGGEEHELSRTKPRRPVNGYQHPSSTTWEETQPALYNSVPCGHLPGPSMVCDYKSILRGPSAGWLVLTPFLYGFNGPNPLKQQTQPNLLIPDIINVWHFFSMSLLKVLSR